MTIMHQLWENVESKQFKEAERLKYMQEAIGLKVNPFSTKFNTNVDSKNDLYGYQNDLNSFEPVTKKEGTYVGNVLEGGWKSGTAFMASTLDVLLPTELISKKLGVTDYADKLFNYYRDANIDQQKQVDLHADTKFKKICCRCINGWCSYDPGPYIDRHDRWNNKSSPGCFFTCKGFKTSLIRKKGNYKNNS